jgi:cellulose biosynthesis protein BcsQ
MLVTCWSVKGGSGTTVVAAALAVTFSRLAPSGALLVDLAGDVPAVLGLSHPCTQGVGDWLSSPDDVGADALDALAIAADDHLHVIPRGTMPSPAVGTARDGHGGVGAPRWEALARALANRPGVTVIDAGLSPIPRSLLHASDESLLVLRPCYLALRRATTMHERPTGVVLVKEPMRVFTAADVEGVIGVPVRAEVGFDPLIARAVDAGLLKARLPYTLTEALRGAA